MEESNFSQDAYDEYCSFEEFAVIDSFSPDTVNSDHDSNHETEVGNSQENESPFILSENTSRVPDDLEFPSLNMSNLPFLSAVVGKAESQSVNSQNDLEVELEKNNLKEMKADPLIGSIRCKSEFYDNEKLSMLPNSIHDTLVKKSKATKDFDDTLREELNQRLEEDLLTCQRLEEEEKQEDSISLNYDQLPFEEISCQEVVIEHCEVDELDLRMSGDISSQKKDLVQNSDIKIGGISEKEVTPRESLTEESDYNEALTCQKESTESKEMTDSVDVVESSTGPTEYAKSKSKQNKNDQKKIDDEKMKFKNRQNEKNSKPLNMKQETCLSSKIILSEKSLVEQSSCNIHLISSHEESDESRKRANSVEKAEINTDIKGKKCITSIQEQKNKSQKKTGNIKESSKTKQSKRNKSLDTSQQNTDISEKLVLSSESPVEQPDCNRPIISCQKESVDSIDNDENSAETKEKECAGSKKQNYRKLKGTDNVKVSVKSKQTKKNSKLLNTKNDEGTAEQSEIKETKVSENTKEKKSASEIKFKDLKIKRFQNGYIETSESEGSSEEVFEDSKKAEANNEQNKNEGNIKPGKRSEKIPKLRKRREHDEVKNPDMRKKSHVDFSLSENEKNIKETSKKNVTSSITKKLKTFERKSTKMLSNPDNKLDFKERKETLESDIVEKEAKAKSFSKKVQHVKDLITSNDDKTKFQEKLEESMQKKELQCEDATFKEKHMKVSELSKNDKTQSEFRGKNRGEKQNLISQDEDIRGTTSLHSITIQEEVKRYKSRNKSKVKANKDAESKISVTNSKPEISVKEKEITVIENEDSISKGKPDALIMKNEKKNKKSKRTRKSSKCNVESNVECSSEPENEREMTSKSAKMSESPEKNIQAVESDRNKEQLNAPKREQGMKKSKKFISSLKSEISEIENDYPKKLKYLQVGIVRKSSEISTDSDDSENDSQHDSRKIKHDISRKRISKRQKINTSKDEQVSKRKKKSREKLEIDKLSNCESKKIKKKFKRNEESESDFEIDVVGSSPEKGLNKNTGKEVTSKKKEKTIPENDQTVSLDGVKEHGAKKERKKKKPKRFITSESEMSETENDNHKKLKCLQVKFVKKSKVSTCIVGFEDKGGKETNKVENYYISQKRVSKQSKTDETVTKAKLKKKDSKNVSTWSEDEKLHLDKLSDNENKIIKEKLLNNSDHTIADSEIYIEDLPKRKSIDQPSISNISKNDVISNEQINVKPCSVLLFRCDLGLYIEDSFPKGTSPIKKTPELSSITENYASIDKKQGETIADGKEMSSQERQILSVGQDIEEKLSEEETCEQFEKTLVKKFKNKKKEENFKLTPKKVHPGVDSLELMFKYKKFQEKKIESKSKHKNVEELKIESCMQNDEYPSGDQAKSKNSGNACESESLLTLNSFIPKDILEKSFDRAPSKTTDIKSLDESLQQPSNVDNPVISVDTADAFINENVKTYPTRLSEKSNAESLQLVDDEDKNLDEKNLYVSNKHLNQVSENISIEPKSSTDKFLIENVQSNSTRQSHKRNSDNLEIVDAVGRLNEENLQISKVKDLNLVSESISIESQSSVANILLDENVKTNPTLSHMQNAEGLKLVYDSKILEEEELHISNVKCSNQVSENVFVEPQSSASITFLDENAETNLTRLVHKKNVQSLELLEDEEQLLNSDVKCLNQVSESIYNENQIFAADAVLDENAKTTPVKRSHKRNAKSLELDEVNLHNSNIEHLNEVSESISIEPQSSVVMQKRKRGRPKKLKDGSTEESSTNCHTSDVGYLIRKNISLSRQSQRSQSLDDNLTNRLNKSHFEASPIIQKPVHQKNFLEDAVGNDHNLSNNILCEIRTPSQTESSVQTISEEKSILSTIFKHFSSSQEMCLEEDGDKMFLLSLLSDFRKIPEENKLDLKTEMIQLLKKFKS